MTKKEKLQNFFSSLKNSIVNLRTNRTFLVCAFLTILYLISGYWKWLEILVSVCALVFMVILPLQSSFCIFAYMHCYTLSNIGYDSCFMVTLIGYCIILLVKYWIGVKKGKYVYYRKLISSIAGFYAITTAVGLLLNIYRGAWLYLTYLPLIFFVFAMRKEFNIIQAMNYMLGGLLTSCTLAIATLAFPGFQYDVFYDNGRFNAFINNTNYLYMRAVFVLSYYMYRYLAGKLSHLKFVSIYLLCALITLATLSKTGIGMLALFTIIFVVFYLREDFKARIKIVGIFVLIGLVLGLICFKLVREIFERFFSSFGSNNFFSSLLTGRDDIWRAYLEKCFENPFRFLFGHGLLAEEVYIPAQGEPRASHNLYIFLLYRFGVVGIIAFAMIIRQFIRLISKDKPQKIAYIPLIMILVESLFDNTFKCYHFTYFLFAVMILYCECKEITDTKINEKNIERQIKN